MDENERQTGGSREMNGSLEGVLSGRELGCPPGSILCGDSCGREEMEKRARES